jgi:hypothetical protein
MSMYRTLCELTRAEGATPTGGRMVEELIQQAAHDALECGKCAVSAAKRGNTDQAGLWAEAAASFARSAVDMAEEHGLRIEVAS